MIRFVTVDNQPNVMLDLNTTTTMLITMSDADIKQLNDDFNVYFNQPVEADIKQSIIAAIDDIDDEQFTDLTMDFLKENNLQGKFLLYIAKVKQKDTAKGIVESVSEDLQNKSGG